MFADKIVQEKWLEFPREALFVLLPPDGDSQAPAWDASLLPVPRALHHPVLWYVDLWLPGGWGILLYRHKKLAQKPVSPTSLVPMPEGRCLLAFF